MYLVGLHIYYKMIHGPYNIKLTFLISTTNYLLVISQDSVVDMATRPRDVRLRISGSIPGRDKRFFSSPKYPDRLLGPAQLPIQWMTEGFLFWSKAGGVGSCSVTFISRKD